MVIVAKKLEEKGKYQAKCGPDLFAFAEILNV